MIRLSLILPLLWALLGAPFQAGAQGRIVFDRNLPARPIGHDILLLEDTSMALSVDEVLASRQFRPSTSDVPNLGLTRSVHWAKFTVVNADPDQRVNLLLDYPEIGEVDVYLSYSGKYRHLLSSGQRRALDRSGQYSPTYTCYLDIPYGDEGTVFVRVRSDKQLQLPMFLVSEKQAGQIALNRSIFIGGYIGIMLVMLLYNLFVYFSIRERAYILYAVYILCVTLAQVSFAGWLGFYVFPSVPWINEHSSLTLTALTASCAVLFMDAFIHARKHIPRFIPTRNAIITALALGVVLDLIGLRILAYSLVQLISLLTSIYMLTAAILLTLKHERSAGFFLVAWVIFLSGVTIFVAKDWGVLPYNDLTKYMMTIGSAIEVVLLSFGLADKINILRKEKDLSQAQALQLAKTNEQIIRHQNTMLEQKVAERTRALQESNDHLKRTQDQLVNAEKMASLGQLTAGIAHEINNPLNFISSSLPPLKRDLLDLSEVLFAYQKASTGLPSFADVHALEHQVDLDGTVQEVKDILSAMENGAQRTSEIVRGLRTFSRLDEDDLKNADLNENIRSTVVVLGPQFRDQVEVLYDLEDMPQVECYPGKLNQLLMNLLNNAAHAVKARHGALGGQVRIATRREGPMAVIIISDNGIGMDGSVRSRLFEPFFTTKDVGEGTGLGLSIAKGIVDKHHGQITVESEVGLGTTFTISIPMVQTGLTEKRA